jgi:hypothetical protein
MDGRGLRKMRAEDVGSTPTRSIFIDLVRYGITLRSISIIVGQIQQQCQCRILTFVRHFVRQKLKYLQEVSDTVQRTGNTLISKSMATSLSDPN